MYTPVNVIFLPYLHELKADVISLKFMTP